MTPEQAAAAAREAEKLQKKMEEITRAMQELEKAADRSGAKLRAAFATGDIEGYATELGLVGDAVNAQIAAYEGLSRQQQEIQLLQAQGHDTTQLEIELAQQQNAIYRDLADTLSQNADAAKLYGDVLDTMSQKGDLAADSLEKLSAKLAKQKQAAGKSDAVFKALEQQVMGLSGGFAKMATLAEGGGMSFKSLGKAAKNFTSKAGIAKAFLKFAQASFEFAMAIEKAEAAFAKATGAGRKYSDQMMAVEKSTRGLGVTMADVTASYQAMMEGMQSFAYMSDQQRMGMAKDIGIYEKLGISQSTQVDILNFATEALGLSAQQGHAQMKEFVEIADSLGETVAGVSAEFLKNKDVLARYGKDAGNVFKEMKVQAKALGMEISTLLGFMDGFKTFDDAGTKVGRLNAIMGGPFLNSMDLMNAALENPVEGIKMMKDALDQAGISAEAMSGAELEAFASALNLSATETRKLLQQSNAELDIQALKQEEMAERAKDSMDIMTELKVAFQQLLIDAKPFIDDVLKPMVRWLGGALGSMGKMISSLGKFGNTAIFAGLALAGLAMLIPGMQPLAIAAIGILGGLAVAGMGALGGGGGEEGGSLEGYASGGIVKPQKGRRGSKTSLAMVGEMGPEMVEMPVGSNVSTSSTTDRLTTAVEDLAAKISKLGAGRGEPIHLSVNIAGEKIDDLVINSLQSPGAASVLGAYPT